MTKPSSPDREVRQFDTAVGSLIKLINEAWLAMGPRPASSTFKCGDALKISLFEVMSCCTHAGRSEWSKSAMEHCEVLLRVILSPRWLLTQLSLSPDDIPAISYVLTYLTTNALSSCPFSYSPHMSMRYCVKLGLLKRRILGIGSVCVHTFSTKVLLPR